MTPPFPYLILRAYEAAWPQAQSHPVIVGAAGIALAGLCAAAAFAGPIAPEAPILKDTAKSAEGE